MVVLVLPSGEGFAGLFSHAVIHEHFVGSSEGELLAARRRACRVHSWNGAE